MHLRHLVLLALLLPGLLLARGVSLTYCTMSGQWIGGCACDDVPERAPVCGCCCDAGTSADVEESEPETSGTATPDCCLEFDVSGVDVALDVTTVDVDASVGSLVAVAVWTPAVLPAAAPSIGAPAWRAPPPGVVPAGLMAGVRPLRI